MKSTILSTFVFAVVSFATFGINVVGQTAASDPRPMAVIAQPDSPIQLVSAATSERPYMVKFVNASDRPVDAFVLVTQSERFDRLQVRIGVVSPAIDSRHYFGPDRPMRLYIDYVLYTDGTSWGPDKFERSKEIAQLFAARAAVINRATQLADRYLNSTEILDRIDRFADSMSGDLFGPPNQIKLDGHVRGAWNTVIDNLRRNTRRPKEANEIADQLEKEKPRPGSCKDPASPVQELNEATAVFSGTVLDRLWVEEPARDGEPAGKRLVIKIKVDRIWKGDVANEALIYTSEIKISDQAAFGVRDMYFKSGSNYLIYASGEPERMKASPCQRTRQIVDAADDLTQLGQGRAPEFN